MNFRDRIRVLRQERGMTLSELAERSGVSKGYLSQLENGKRTTLSVPVGRRIAAALRVDLNTLFAEDEGEVGPTTEYPPVIQELMRRRKAAGRPLTPDELTTLLGLRYRGRHPRSADELEILLDQLKLFTRDDDS